jgi:hypothetical protein
LTNSAFEFASMMGTLAGDVTNKRRRSSTLNPFQKSAWAMMARKMDRPELEYVYPFGGSESYMNVLDVLLLFSCLYWALLLMSFGRIAARLGAAWVALVFVPPVLWTGCLTAIVKSAALVHAVVNIDLDIIGHIQEATDEQAYEAIRDEAINSFRSRMLEKIGSSSDKEGKLFVCFNNFDLDGKGRLNYHELRMLTRNLNIHMTYATFDFLFRRGAASILAIRARARAGDFARRARLSVGPSTRRWTTSSTSRSSATPCCRSSRPRPTRSPRARARGPSSTTSRRRSSAPRGRGPRLTGGRRRRRSPPPATGRGPRATAARAATSRSSRGRRRGRRTCCP